MTETTENIRLVKESEDEFYSVHTVNENLDKIDEAFGKKVDKKEEKSFHRTIIRMKTKKNWTALKRARRPIASQASKEARRRRIRKALSI